MSAPKINPKKLEKERQLSLRCDYCGEHGHKANRCPNKPKTPKKANRKQFWTGSSIEDYLE